ncbi:predicted protein [Arabidopsis lyrata subsp. lyrata]|uniref:Predicted protein n=1 Tax=Arabidopsis lyrata subsp. lyrata TaxID=81972 RepID=D7L3B2_ARALL|nr:predicted protein [Arabidopsis lyrata subsp. lyrata]
MSSKKLVLKSSDGQLVEIDQAEAVQSTLIKELAAEMTDETQFEVPNVCGSVTPVLP